MENSRMLRRLAACLAVVAVLASGRFAPGDAAPPAVAEPGDEFNDPVTPFEPRQARSEKEEDRLAAAALYTHGRMLYQRGKQAEALWRLERAWRYDPAAVSILDEIFEIANELQRYGESARYAVLRCELKPDNPLLLRGVAGVLVGQGELQRALGLYEKSLRPDDPPEGPEGEITVLREMGQLYLLNGQAEKSADAFQKVLDAVDHPERSGLDEKKINDVLGKQDRTFTLMAESFLQAGRHDLAEQLFGRADKSLANPARLKLNLARVDAARGKTGAALKKLDDYLATKDATAGQRPFMLLAELLEKKHKDKTVARTKLLERLEKLRANDPGNADLVLFHAAQLAAAEKLEDAAAAYLAAIPLVEDASAAHKGLIDVERRRGDAAKLLEALARVAVQEARLDSVESLVEQIVADEKLIDGVLERAAARKQNGDEQPGEYLAAAWVALAAKKFDRADELLELALSQPLPKGEEELLTAWGLALIDAGRYGQSVAVLREVLESVKKDDKEKQALFRFYLSVALEAGEKSDEALAEAREAADLLPTSLRFQSRPAWIMYRAKRLEEAERAYEQFIAKHRDDYTSTDTREMLRETRLIVSSICVQRGKMPAAEQWIEQVLDEFPEDVGALNDLGYLWADQGKHLARSLEMTTKAVAAEPDNAAYRDSLGWAHFRLGNFHEAVKHLEQAAGKEDPDGVILDHLGDAYLAAKQLEKALETWRRAEAAFEKEKDADMLEKTRRKIKQHAS